MVRQTMVSEPKSKAINAVLNDLHQRYGAPPALTPEQRHQAATRWNEAIRRYSRSKARQVRPEILVRCQGCCEICGDYQPWTLQVHHVVPVRSKGEGTPDNLAALCPNCHAVLEVMIKRKGDIAEFQAWFEERYSDQQLARFNDFVSRGKRK